MHSSVISVSEGGGCFSDPSRYCTQDTLWGQKKYHFPFFHLPPPFHPHHTNNKLTHTRVVEGLATLFGYFIISLTRPLRTSPPPSPPFADFSSEFSYYPAKTSFTTASSICTPPSSSSSAN